MKILMIGAGVPRVLACLAELAADTKELCMTMMQTAKASAEYLQTKS
jgi:hypothetical protein